MSAGSLIKRNEALSKGVFEVLTLCVDMKYPGEVPDLNDDRIIGSYVAALVSQGIDAAIFKRSLGTLFSDIKFFPRPEAIVKACIPHRVAKIEEERQTAWANARTYADENGNLIAVIGDASLPELGSPIVSDSKARAINARINSLGHRGMPKSLSASNEIRPIVIDHDEEDRRRALIEIVRKDSSNG